MKFLTLPVLKFETESLLGNVNRGLGNVAIIAFRLNDSRVKC